MTDILTAAQMRAHEAAAFDRGATTPEALMIRAGEAATSAIRERHPEPGRALVLCGPGNNGGDGYVVACGLRAAGWRVRVEAMGGRGDPARASGPAAAARARWEAEDPVHAFDDARYAAGPPDVDLVVDALFGIGLARPFEAPHLLGALDAAHGAVTTVALDIPSGLETDTGHALAAAAAPPGAVRADLTLAFHALKPAHLLAAGGALCGAVQVLDIGLPPHLAPWARRVDGPLLALAKGQGHKYDHGHALILSGGVGQGGAARLSARAAARIGAGATTLAGPPRARREAAIALPDAIMTRKLPDGAALAALLSQRPVTAIGLGPGLGVPRADEMLAALAALGPERPPLCLDADALTALADRADAATLLRPEDVLTPHVGEFRRLAPDLAASLGTGSKIALTRTAADRFGCTILLKGSDTVIASPGATPHVAAATGPAATPWLATAGAGDVLTGLVTGLMARGHPGHAAAATAARLHQDAARRLGPGMIADDLPEALPGLLADLGA
ncbi:MAG: NAD(P)H-hydrate dehydratase [Shimia sp.]